MRVSVLGSGSRGNCTYVESRQARLLIDAGFGIRALKRRLKDAGLELTGLDAILLTHGHRDHVSGVQSIVRATGARVFMTQGTLDEVPVLRKVDRREILLCGVAFAVRDIDIRAFRVPHDAAEPVGFTLRSEESRGVVATDLGEFTVDILREFQECDWLVLESNHDEQLLRIGPYPWELKRRVLSNRGHLSNQSLADFLQSRFDGKASDIFLAHLSQQNNDPELALESAFSALSRRRASRNGASTRVHLTHQDKPSIVLSL